MKSKLSTKNGITLIALIVTIIVLLILAAVIIATLTGENGLLERASRARIYTRKAQAEDTIKLGIEAVQVSKNGEATIQDILDEFKKNERTDIEVIEVVTGEVATISCEIPEGNLEEITVIVDKYKEFSFTIGNNLEITKICGIAKDLWNGQTLNDVGSADRITITVSPESQTTSYVGSQEVEITATNTNKWTTWQAQTVWSTSSETAPTQGWETLTLNDGSNDYEKTAEVTNVGEQEQTSYYLWVRIITGTATKTQKFGPYNIESVPTQSNFICRVTEKRNNNTEGTLLVGTTEVFENWTLKYKVNSGEETTITGATTTTTVKQGDTITLKYTRTGYTDVIKTVTIDELVTDSLTASLTFNKSNELTEGTIATLNGTATSGVSNVELKIGSYTVYSETIANSQASYSKQLSIDDMSNLTSLTFLNNYSAQLTITGASGSTQNSSIVTVSNYTIGTATQLKALASAVTNSSNPNTFEGKTIYQIADIALNSSENFNPIGYRSTTDYPFCGTYSGYNPKTETNRNITGLYINNPSTTDKTVGLFGYVTTGGTIKNITVSGSVTQNNSTYTGAGIVAYCNGGSVDNCTSNVNVTNFSSNNTGGIVAGLNNGNITNCTNTGTIENKSDLIDSGRGIGGISGNNLNSTIQNCTNTGAIISKSSKAGGIVGGVYGESTISSCKNTGAITSKGNPSDQANTQGTGGIVGRLEYGTIENCGNTGSIKAETGYFAGGICGYAKNTATKIEKCYNYNGNVETYLNGVGGIVGRSNGITISKCYNYLTSNSYYIKSTTGKNVGGIVGVIADADGATTSTLDNCYSVGENITGTYKGNMIGKNTRSDTTITNCYQLSGSSLNGIGNNSTNPSTEDIKTKDATYFTKDETDSESVAYLLNGNSASGEWETDTTGVINNGYPYLKNARR